MNKQTLDPRGAASSGWRALLCPVSAFAAVALIFMKVATPAAHAQGPYFNTTNPAGTINGISAAAGNYTGSPIATDAEAGYLQAILQQYYGTSVTLQAALLVPPTTFVAPTLAQYRTAVEAATISILGGTAPIPVATPVPPSVTLASFASQAVDSNYNNRQYVVQSISSAIIGQSGAPVTDLNTVLAAVSASAPAGIQVMILAIQTEAVKSTATINAVPDLTAKALFTSRLALLDAAVARGIVLSGIQSIAAAPAGVLADLTAKSNFYLNSYIPGIFNDPVLNPRIARDPAYIDTLVTNLVSSSALAMSSLPSVLNKVVSVLPAPAGYPTGYPVGPITTTTNQLLGGVALGALRTVGASAPQAALVKSTLANPYTDGVVDGYTATAATYASVLTGNPTRADAIASGATLRALVPATTLVQSALSTGFGQVDADPTITATRILQGIVAAQPAAATSNAGNAITTALYGTYGASLFSGVARGSILAAPQSEYGNIMLQILIKAALVPTVGAYTSTNVNLMLNQAITSAYEASRQGGVGDIVWETINRARLYGSFTGPAVTQAIQTIAARDPNKPGYVAVVPALVSAGVSVPLRNEVLTAAFGPDMIVGGDNLGALATTSSDQVAADWGRKLVVGALAAPGTTFQESMKQFTDAQAGGSPNGVLAGILGAILIESADAEAVVAAAIRQTTLSSSDIVTAAADAVRAVDPIRDVEVRLAQKVASDLKNNLNGERDRLLDYVGRAVVADPNRAQIVATAATVIDPNHAHFVAESVAFNNPTLVGASVKNIFKYAQITSSAPYIYATGAHSASRAILDQPGAAAAITAAMTTGIMEARLSPANTQAALSTAVTAAVVASINQQGKDFLGQAQPFINDGGDTSSFRQANGTAITGVPVAGNIVSGTVRTVGAAGAITGYVAQVTKPLDLTISATTAAVLTAATTGYARPYAMQMAQAAAQAFRWVVDSNAGAWQTAGTWTGTGTNEMAVATAIANAINISVNGYNTNNAAYGILNFTKLYNAALFGLYEAANGTIGAGALGLNATGLNSTTTTTFVVKASGNANSSFYLHKSAAGTPVTDIFNL